MLTVRVAQTAAVVLVMDVMMTTFLMEVLFVKHVALTVKHVQLPRPAHFATLVSTLMEVMLAQTVLLSMLIGLTAVLIQ